MVLLVSSRLGRDREIGDSPISLFPVRNGANFQYIDKEGKIVINPQFSSATLFKNGIALVRSPGEEGLWGFINEQGKYSIPATYKQATVFSEDLAWVVTENGTPKAINTKGEVKITLQNAESVHIFKESLAAFEVFQKDYVHETKYGFLDKTGKVAISPQFVSAGDFSGGKCAVQNDAYRWGYIDRQGKTAIPFEFEHAGKFVDGQAIVFVDGKYGAIDETGKYVITPQFDGLYQDGDLYLIKQNGKTGWATRQGKVVVNPQFAAAFTFNGAAVAPVQVGESWGYMDKAGKIIIKPQFDVALPFVGGVAAVMRGGKVGFIDSAGKYLVSPQYEEISYNVLNHILDGQEVINAFDHSREEGDFFSYLGQPFSYETVNTDFFNTAPIVGRVNFNAPEGLPLTSTLGDVIKKLGITEEAFSDTTSQHKVIPYASIAKNVSLAFSIWADSHTKKGTRGWLFDANAPVQGYGYTFTLFGDHADKSENIVAAIEKTITGMKKDKIESEEYGYIVYKSAAQLVYLEYTDVDPESGYSEVIITILRADLEIDD
jgi:hypothetical protein